MKEEWLFPGAVVPVDVETTAALVVEIKRLIDVVGGMALVQSPQRTWVGLAEEEVDALYRECNDTPGFNFGGFARRFARATEAKLKEKNT